MSNYAPNQTLNGYTMPDGHIKAEQDFQAPPPKSYDTTDDDIVNFLIKCIQDKSLELEIVKPNNYVFDFNGDIIDVLFAQDGIGIREDRKEEGKLAKTYKIRCSSAKIDEMVKELQKRAEEEKITFIDSFKTKYIKNV